VHEMDRCFRAGRDVGPAAVRCRDFYINLASQILIAAIFAASLNCCWLWRDDIAGTCSYLGVAAYLSALLTSRYGLGHGSAACHCHRRTTAMAALFGVIALRATGLGFLMITLALSQWLWAWPIECPA